MWGKIVTAVVISAILGGISFAWAQNATNSEIKTTIEAMEERSRETTKSLEKVDAKVEAVQMTVNDMREQQARTDTKIDMLLQQAKQPVAPSPAR